MIEDAYYFRLKEVRLAYNFNPALLNRVGVDHLTLYVMGYNLGVITNVQYLDPENINDRGEYYPQQRSVMFGINLKF